VRQGRWKLIQYNVKGVKTTQLFDLQSDPWEMHNLADDPARQETRAQLEQLLKRARQELGDPIEFH